MTEGRFALPTSAATRSGLRWLVIANPTGATTINLPQKVMKFRRLTPARSRRAAMESYAGVRDALMRGLSFRGATLEGRHTGRCAIRYRSTCERSPHLSDNRRAAVRAALLGDGVPLAGAEQKRRRPAALHAARDRRHPSHQAAAVFGGIHDRRREEEAGDGGAGAVRERRESGASSGEGRAERDFEDAG